MSHDRSPELAHRIRWMAGQAGLVTLGVLIYFGVRGRTADSELLAREHAADIVALERHIGLDVVAGIVLALIGYAVRGAVDEDAVHPSETVRGEDRPSVASMGVVEPS